METHAKMEGVLKNIQRSKNDHLQLPCSRSQFRPNGHVLSILDLVYGVVSPNLNEGKMIVLCLCMKFRRYLLIRHSCLTIDTSRLELQEGSSSGSLIIPCRMSWRGTCSHRYVQPLEPRMRAARTPETQDERREGTHRREPSYVRGHRYESSGRGHLDRNETSGTACSYNNDSIALDGAPS